MAWMTRGMGAALAASLLALAGCGEEEPEWDGSFTPMDEMGDWQDNGAYASCQVKNVNPCGMALESFDLSSCKNSTLKTFQREGIYRAKLRYEFPSEPGYEAYVAEGAGSFRFGPDGNPMSLHGLATTDGLANEQMFIATALRTDNARRQFAYTLAGCEAPTIRTLTGCFTTCVDGEPVYRGTFIAERMTWGRSEPESSGDFKPISESFVELGHPVDIYVAKDHAYVVSVSQNGEAGGLTVFDVRDRKHPIFKSSISIPGDNYWNGVWAKGDALYVASADTGLVVFDITNPGQPEFLRSLPGNESMDVHTVLVDGDRLYAMSPSHRTTYIYDVTSPLAPVLLGHYRLNGQGYPHDAFAYGGRLYVSHTQGGYQVLDVTDPSNVRLLGGYSFPGNYAHHSAVGTIKGQTIAFEGGERMGSHVRVLKVDDPKNIVKIGEFKLRDVTSVHNMLLVGSRLYIAWYQEGVRVLDVSNPTKLKHIAHFNTFRDTDTASGDGMYEGVLGIRVPGDGHVYAVDDVRGLLIFQEP